MAAARDFDADVVMLDIGMPEIDGYEIARIFRRMYGTTKPMLVAVTAWNRSADKLMARAAGFDHHFGKPYDPNELLALLRGLATQR